MFKRPQSAISKPSIFSKVDDIIGHQTGLPDYYSKRPFSGVSDKIFDQPKRSQDLDMDLHQARYALKLNQIESALDNYRLALNRAVQLVPSFQFIELFQQVFKIINEKALQLSKENDSRNASTLTQTLLQWTQVQRAFNPPDFLNYMKCPVVLQMLALNSNAQILMKQHRYDESQEQLELALTLISAAKIEDQVQQYIGLTYLNYSTSLLYQQQYNYGMELAQTALTYLQQSVLQGVKDDQYDVYENISEAYTNIAISKEKLKLYQEAHFNYYSALVNAKQHLDEQKQLDINNIYDKFLSRQAGYLQMLNPKKMVSRYTDQYGRYQRDKSTPQMHKTQKQPFIDLVKSLEESGRIAPSNLIKRQRILMRQKRELIKKEQKSLNKFKPYVDQVPSSSSSNKTIIKKRSEPRLINTLQQERKFTNNTEGERTSKTFKITKKSTSSLNINSNPQPVMKINEEEMTSPVIRQLEGTIRDTQMMEIQDVVQLEDFQELRLPSDSSSQQQSMIGTLYVYLFRTKNILYLRYESMEQVENSQGQNRYTLTYTDRYQQQIYGHSFNVSDIANEIYSNDGTDKRFAQFLRGFIMEICRYLFINKTRRSLSLLRQPQLREQPITFYLTEIEDYVSVQSKNDFESLVFIQTQSTDINQEEILPLVFKDNTSAKDDEDEIQPLIAIQENERYDDKDDEDIQPLIAQQTDSDFEQDPIMIKQTQNQPPNYRKQRMDYDQAIEVFDIQEESHSLEKTQKDPSRIRTMEHMLTENNNYEDRSNNRPEQEKFTIKIASEDQASREEVIEVYAQKKEVTDPELEEAAKLIQKRFRLMRGGK